MRPSEPRTTYSTAASSRELSVPANPLRGHLRLTVRTREENEQLLEAVASIAD